jgi:hypothetical protein
MRIQLVEDYDVTEAITTYRIYGRKWFRWVELSNTRNVDRAYEQFDRLKKNKGKTHILKPLLDTYE